MKKNIDTLVKDIYSLFDLNTENNIDEKDLDKHLKSFTEGVADTIKVLLKENTQIILSPGPVIFELRRLLKDYSSKDYLLLSGDPAVIGLACSIVSDINGGKFNLLKWDRQEKLYYPLEINLFEKGKIDD